MLRHPLLSLLCLLCLVLNFAAAQTPDKPTLVSDAATLLRLAPLGGHLQLAAGHYELSEPLVLKESLSLRGAGAQDTVIALSAAPVALTLEGTGEFRFEGLHFIYAGVSGGDIMNVRDATLKVNGCRFEGAVFGETDEDVYGEALYLYGKAVAQVSDSVFTANGLAAIQLDETATLKLVGSHILNNANGLELYDETRLVARDNVFEGGGADGYALYAENDATLELSGNTFQSIPGAALLVRGGASVTLSGDTFEDNGGEGGYAALTFLDWATGTVTASTFETNSEGAISLFNEASVLLTENLITDNDTYAAVYLSGTAEAVLTDNRILANEGSGVYSVGNPKLELAGNLIADNRGEAAVTLLELTKAELSDNDVTGNVQTGVYLGETARATLSDNRISDNQGTGVLVDDTARATLLENLISGNGEFGVNARSASHVVLTNNTVDANRSGVVVDDDATALIEDNEVTGHERSGIGFLGRAGGAVENNRIRDNRSNGIAVGGEATPVIANNLLENNVLRGILFFGQAGGTVTGNTLSGSRYGLFSADAAAPTLQDNTFLDNDQETGSGELAGEE